MDVAALREANDLGTTRARARTRSLLLIANANASGLADVRRSVERARSLLSGFGARVDARATATQEELAEVFRGSPHERVVVLGGDGSLHALANLPAAAGREIALLPAGRANNIATTLGLPTDLAAAASLAVSGAARPLDAIVATSARGCYRAVEGVSVGYLARARVRYRGRNSADLPAGVAAGIKALPGLRPLRIELEADGVGDVVTAPQLFAANLSRYGFGLHVAPGADPSDGLLDLVVLESRGRLSLLQALARMRRGDNVPAARLVKRARYVRIDPAGASPVVSDSTSLGSGPVELVVERAALKVVTPSP